MTGASMIPRGLKSPEVTTVYRWLAENGIMEWLPRSPMIEVDRGSGTLSYTSYRWRDNQRGFDGTKIDPGPTISYPITETRTVPLRVPPGPEVHAAVRELHRSDSWDALELIDRP